MKRFSKVILLFSFIGLYSCANDSIMAILVPRTYSNTLTDSVFTIDGPNYFDTTLVQANYEFEVHSDPDQYVEYETQDGMGSMVTRRAYFENDEAVIHIYISNGSGTSSESDDYVLTLQSSSKMYMRRVHSEFDWGRETRTVAEGELD